MCPIIQEFHHIDTSKSVLYFMVPSVEEVFHYKYCQNYIIMTREIYKAIPNTIICPVSTLAYKSLQHVITEDDG